MSMNVILAATNATITGQPEPTVGMGATYFVGSDRYPYHVVRVLSPKMIVLRAAKYRRTDKNGFSESQTYEISPMSCPETCIGQEVLVTLRKNGRWICKGKTMRGAGACYLIGEATAYRDPSF